MAGLEHAQSMMYATGSYRPHKVRKIEKQQAQLDASEAKEVTAKLVRTLYANVIGLEEAYNQTIAQQKSAQEILRLANVRYENGMATKLEVLTAEVAVTQAETEARGILQQHAYLKLAFQKPWAMVSGAAQTSN